MAFAGLLSLCFLAILLAKRARLLPGPALVVPLALRRLAGLFLHKLRSPR